ncbi:MAG: TIGR04211 family SH3 domain-containing protein [Natronospirillum sp.]|uniref:TIGR04211 family SH3 domain-containing protein n=1 Tax=Natronospirillum sp. TaxID=2812955 RepID=UPI0025E611FB|nr:TIGR04211 family SH3 domain-containing protein [Natronospirillum sp.]MCH8551852.1 TIGR04211 family SH3 domain-containing protein [Natronospirillum sp.]
MRNTIIRTPVWLLTSLLFIALLTPATSLAQETDANTRYISDILLVPLRTGPSLEYRIVNAGLRSGTQVTLLENDAATQWSRIRVGQQEGWLPTRHLSEDPIARDQLEAMEQEVEELRAENDRLRQQYADLLDDNLSADEVYANIEAERDDALAELDRVREISSNALMLDERNEELLSRNRILENENEQLRSINESLEGDANQWRMIVGGGLVLMGLLMGLILPPLIRRRRSDGWN